VIRSLRDRISAVNHNITAGSGTNPGQGDVDAVFALFVRNLRPYPLIEDSLKVIDAVLKVETLSLLATLQSDGFGQRATRRNRLGKGGLAVLTGERAIRTGGRDVKPYIKTLEGSLKGGRCRADAGWTAGPGVFGSRQIRHAHVGACRIHQTSSFIHDASV